jgi:hypothetical protein
MDKFHWLKNHSKRLALVIVLTILLAIWLAAQSSSGSMARSDKDLLEGFRRVEVASVSDAIEQLTGQRMYLSHRMQPIFTTKFAGPYS